MFETWEILGIGLVSLFLLILVVLTVIETIHRYKNKRKQPQDHYFAERKKKDE